MMALRITPPETPSLQADSNSPATPTTTMAGQSSTLGSSVWRTRSRSTSTLASAISQRSQAKSHWSMTSKMSTPPETKYSSLAYGVKDDLGKATIYESETGTRLTRHSTLWLGDGSVICRAEDTLFCVHMSVLARHSAFFQDLFSIPQPGLGGGDSLVLEGVGMRSCAQQIPVLTLFDKADDVANLINALYNIGTKFGSNNDADFRTVAGILRLATKYIIDELREMALAHLRLAWPSTLKAWDLREDQARTQEIDVGIPAINFYPHPFEVITLAREVNAPELLPAAFYDLSRYSFSQIFEAQEEEPLYRSPEEPSVTLSPADLQRLCVGKEQTQQMITSLIQAMGIGHPIRLAQSHSPHNILRRSSSSGTVCMSPAACRKDFSELVQLATQHYLFDRERGCHDPLYVAEELGQLKTAEVSECKACAKSLEAWAARERERIWRMIPAWFRLDLPDIDDTK
ncbi:hypothetical protein BKA70DRAFT_472051 [Coprinopsis sp. MPI-PUGE-AT-0042]|nr:hypothetical protein BKA70DRAFT_472051 [Coprinopsis sp. MPI-PUGE-AT-0042]